MTLKKVEGQSVADKYLSQMLEAHEQGLKGITQFIDDTSKQLEAAKTRREEMQETVREIKSILGLEDEHSQGILKAMDLPDDEETPF